MSEDSTFDYEPSAEEREAAEQDAELARRIRAEVVRVTSGEAEEDLAEDERIRHEEQEQERTQEAESARQSVWQVLASGKILLHEGVVRYYSHMLVVIVLIFISIVVMFWSLRVDMRHSALSNEVQLLRERSIRMRESSYSQSSHSAISRELERRKIDLQDAKTPSMVMTD